MITYFVFSPEFPTRVKIGRSTQLKNRLSALNADSPVELVLYATTEVPEAELHSKFAHLRVKGEWFHFGDEIAVWINENATTYPIDYAGPTWAEKAMRAKDKIRLAVDFLADWAPELLSSPPANTPDDKNPTHLYSTCGEQIFASASEAA